MKKVLLSFCFVTAFAVSNAQKITKPCTGGRFDYAFVVLKADDKVSIYVNGAIVKTITTDGDPDLNERIDITPHLQLSVGTGFVNQVRIDGYNGPTGYHDFPILNPKLKENPSHFVYAIEKKCSTTGEYENVIPKTEYRGAAPLTDTKEMLVYSKTHELVKE